MKKVILLAIFLPYMAFGQVIENFESGNIENWVQSSDGHWSSDSSDCISGRFSLHHSYDNNNAGSDQIGTLISNLHVSEGLTRWSFLIRHGYNPSTSNNWSVFLLSDSKPSDMIVNSATNGFVLGINLSGSDDTLRLWKLKNGQLTTVANSHINWQTSIGVTDVAKIVVERTMEGNWSIEVYMLNEDLVGSGSGTDTELFSNDWFGILYRYSSSCDRLLWFDDLTINGKFYEDIKAPSVSGYRISGMNSIEITLNEIPADEFISAENFSLNDTDNSVFSVNKIHDQTFKIQFADIFNNKKSNTLIISSICDGSGNCDHNIQVIFTPVWTEPGDVIISEIMADPIPEVSLPEKEYFELTNRTKFPFNLKKWKLLSQNQEYVFQEKIIQPGEILIVCLSQDTSYFKEYGKVIGLKQFPALTDGGRILCLCDSLDNLIHGVEYSSKWYNDELKSRGGWSLEMIDSRFPFNYEKNWTASLSRKGGTPGKVNSVSRNNPDIQFYGVQNVFPNDSLTISVRFSEPVFNLCENISSIAIAGKEIDTIYPADPLLRKFALKLGAPLKKREEYKLIIAGEITDFTGNKIQRGIYFFGLTEPPAEKDILFNELLFNPLPGDPDYLEIFNCSGKIIDASRLQLISVNVETGDTSQLYHVSDEKRVIMPGAYYAITTEGEKVTNRYFSADPEYLFIVESLPSMPDDEGHLVLYNMELDKIDEVIYNEDMHYSLLSGVEGIALEKIKPFYVSETEANWHSASEDSGWGSPGAKNSMFTKDTQSTDMVLLSSSKISPDNDGFEDILDIAFQLKGKGNVVSVTIFDETGSFVKKVAENMFLGSEASLIWDGTTEEGSLVNTGIYIVFITLFDDTGKINRWKKVCTVVRPR